MKKYIVNTKVQIIISIILSIIVGVIFNRNQILCIEILNPLGNVFLNLIKCFMIPLIFFSIVMGILNLGNLNQLKRIGIKILLFFMITTIIASIIGLSIGKVFDLNIENLQMSDNTDINANIGELKIITSLFAFVPENLMNVFINNNIIQIIFIAIIFGCVLLKYNQSMKLVINFCDELNELFKKIISGVLKLIPIGIFVLLTPVIVNNNFSNLIILGKVILAYILACCIHIIFVYIPIILYSKKVKVGTFFKTIFPTIILAFSSASSLATLGSSMESTKKLGVREEISKFTLPLGATINMDGTAIFLSIISLFIATIYGIELSFVQMLLLILVIVATSIGTPGIPGASLIIIAVTLESVGLPLSGIGLIAGIDILLEMFGTAMNVCGDIVCSLLIDKKYETNIINK